MSTFRQFYCDLKNARSLFNTISRNELLDHIFQIIKDYEFLEGYFPITFIHRNDLSDDFNIEEISDIQMLELADKMADDYCEQLFHQHKVDLANILNFPTLEEKELNRFWADLPLEEKRQLRNECYE